MLDSVEAAGAGGEFAVELKDGDRLICEAFKGHRVEPRQVFRISLGLLADAPDERHGVWHPIRGEIVGEGTIAPQRFTRVENGGCTQSGAGFRIYEHAEVVPVPVEVGKDVVHDERGVELAPDIRDTVRLTCTGIGFES